MVRKQRATKLSRVLPEHKRLNGAPEYVEELRVEFLAKVNRVDIEPQPHIMLNDFFRERVPASYVGALKGVQLFYCCAT